MSNRTEKEENVREDREDTLRDIELRDEPWKPLKRLPDPRPSPSVEYRWVRTKIRGEDDNINVSQAFRSGWEPCDAKEFEYMKLISDRKSDFPGCLEVSGMLLCQRSREIGEQLRKRVAESAERQKEAVEAQYKNNEHKSMPVFSDQKTEV